MAPISKKISTKTMDTQADRKPNLAFMRPVSISKPLAEVVGSLKMPRSEVTQKVWEYIKKNSLQDSVNRRQINADEKLRVVFGGKTQVSMFEITQLLNEHLN